VPWVQHFLRKKQCELAFVHLLLIDLNSGSQTFDED
jgi:hypothetical protein